MSHYTQDQRNAAKSARFREKLAGLTEFEKRIVDRLLVAGPSCVTKLAKALWSSDPTGRSKACNVVTGLRRLHEAELVVSAKSRSSWRLSAWAVRAIRSRAQGSGGAA